MFPLLPLKAVTYIARNAPRDPACTSTRAITEDWLSSTSLLTVQLHLLSVDSSCSVAISSSTEGECNAGGSGESSSAVTGIVAGVLTAVFLVIIVALIVILALVYKHRYSTINIKERE